MRFSTVAFSNLSRDHLDYHRDLQHYGEAKARLFRAGARTAVINLDDAFGRTLAASLPAETACLGVSMDGNPAARLRGELLQAGAEGLVLDLSGEFGTVAAQQPPVGAVQCREPACWRPASCWPKAGRSRVSSRRLPDCTAPPGRMQRVPASAAQPAVLVDFAHTADALRKALAAVRAHCSGQLWCVFGCGGNRDRGKRAPMGSVAAELADHVIVTDDNPARRRSAADHRRHPCRCGRRRRPVQVIPDRAAAIQRAIHSAAPGDVILIAGKGHEQTQIVAGVSRPFSDVAVAVAALSVAQQGPGA